MSDLVAEEKDVEQNLSCNENNKSQSPSAMFLYLRELFFLLALVLTSYTALFNSMPKVGKPPAPVPFFQRKSIVVDHYKGTVNSAFQKASEVDLTVVMYYAPWDAESQAARDEFEATAQFLYDEVYFTAISCWSPNTECKQHLPRIRHFPVIVAYPLHKKGIHYQGPIKSVYLINFIKSLMRPLHRISSGEDLIWMANRYSTFLIGSFYFTGNLGGHGFYTFYSAALKVLENDPYREIGFGVTTNRKTASEINFKIVPSIRLYNWNVTYEYPVDSDYTEDDLIKWIWRRRQEVIEWVSPPKAKSHMLSSHIIDRPALILFTPRNPLVEVIPMFNMVRALALRYFNCENDTSADSLASIIEIQDRNLKSKWAQQEDDCMEINRQRQSTKPFISSYLMPDVLLNNSGDVCHVKSLHSRFFGSPSDVCFSEVQDIKYQDYKSLESYKSPEKLLDSWKEFKCGIVELANEYYRLPFPKLFDSDQSINRLACANNRTLSMIAMDSLLYYQFAEALGINIQEMKGKTALAIIDKNSESQYVLKKTVTRSSVIEFLSNHTKRELSRHLRSSHDVSSRSLTRYRYPIRKKNCTHTETQACVPELNSRNFLHFVLNQTTATLVFYHTPYCALCRSISHLFLLLSRYFRFFPGLKFARIDGENNDLPWEYTMNMFPALLFFPTFDKAESRLYSNNLPFTIRNLIHFVLANLEPEAKIPAMISLCLSFEKLQNEEEARKCKSKIQKESYENLSKTLKNLRRTMSRWKNLPPSSSLMPEVRRQKKIYFFKLEYFKTIHFLLGSVDQLQLESTVVSEIVVRWCFCLWRLLVWFYGDNYTGVFDGKQIWRRFTKVSFDECDQRLKCYLL